MVTEEGVPRGESLAAGVADTRDASAFRIRRVAPRVLNEVARGHTSSDRAVRGDGVARVGAIGAGERFSGGRSGGPDMTSHSDRRHAVTGPDVSSHAERVLVVTAVRY